MLSGLGHTSHAISELTLHAFTASMDGVSDNDIQILGLWKFSFYKANMRIPELILFFDTVEYKMLVIFLHMLHII